MILNSNPKHPLVIQESYKLTKYKEKRGHIYLITIDRYPEYIKVGKAHYLSQRIHEYHKNLPLCSIKLLAYTRPFINVEQVENDLLSVLTEKFSPIKGRKEWFLLEAKNTILSLMYEAEKINKVCNLKEREGLFI